MLTEYSKVIRFLLYCLGLCFGWFILHDLWLSSFDDYLTNLVVNLSVGFLQFAGYNAESENIMIQINGRDTVYVYHACNGMVLMALYIGFIIAFPGPVLKKLVFIPLGVVAINALNILRVSALALNAFYYDHTLDFNHKYTFTIIVYAAIFGLWMLWVKRYSGIRTYTNVSEA